VLRFLRISVLNILKKDWIPLGLSIPLDWKESGLGNPAGRRETSQNSLWERPRGL